MTTGFANPLRPVKPSGYPEAIERAKSSARRALGLSDDAVISVTELSCRDPKCPDVETVIAVFRAEAETLVLRVHKPIPDITEADLVQAVPNAQRASGRT
jgi:hypothetical protein